MVGNDVVTELKKDPNNADTKWWSPGWLPQVLTIPTTPGPCQPLTLSQHSTSIRTNSTLPIFTYSTCSVRCSLVGIDCVAALLNGLGTFRNGTPKWFDSLPYRSEPLENCTVQTITALINFQDRGHKLKVVPRLYALSLSQLITLARRKSYVTLTTVILKPLPSSSSPPPFHGWLIQTLARTTSWDTYPRMPYLGQLTSMTQIKCI
jgi:hypothetical protein